MYFVFMYTEFNLPFYYLAIQNHETFCTQVYFYHAE